MKTGYERWREWIDLARAVGEFDGAWITVELLHLIDCPVGYSENDRMLNVEIKELLD